VRGLAGRKRERGRRGGGAYLSCGGEIGKGPSLVLHLVTKVAHEPAHKIEWQVFVCTRARASQINGAFSKSGTAGMGSPPPVACGVPMGHLRLASLRSTTSKKDWSAASRCARCWTWPPRRFHVVTSL
jgi:hypothetical protein